MFEENRLALEVFLRLSTQWVVGEGVVRGLNYQSAQWVIGLMAVDQPWAVFDDLQTMEGAALDVLNKRNAV